jgi:hypothetical protein
VSIVVVAALLAPESTISALLGTETILGIPEECKKDVGVRFWASIRLTNVFSDFGSSVIANAAVVLGLVVGLGDHRRGDIIRDFHDLRPTGDAANSLIDFGYKILRNFF